MLYSNSSLLSLTYIIPYKMDLDMTENIFPEASTHFYKYSVTSIVSIVFNHKWGVC